MDISKQADDFFFHLQMQLNSMNIDRVASNLKTHELNILHIINYGSKEKGGVYVSEIANSLGLPMSAVSRSLKHLEDEMHYIVRKSDQKDRRNTLVTMTEEGRTEYKHVMAFAKEFGQKIFSCLTSEERHQYLEMSDKLHNAAKSEFAKLCQQEP